MIKEHGLSSCKTFVRKSPAFRPIYLRPSNCEEVVASGRAAICDDVEHDELCFGRRHSSVDFAVQHDSRSFTFHTEHDRRLTDLNDSQLTALTFYTHTHIQQSIFNVRLIIIRNAKNSKIVIIIIIYELNSFPSVPVAE